MDTRIARSITWIFYNNVEILEKNSQGIEQSLQGKKLMELLHDIKEPHGQYVLNLVESKISQSCKHIETAKELALLPPKINRHIDNMTKILIPILVEEIIDKCFEMLEAKKNKIGKLTKIKPTLQLILSEQLQIAYIPELLEILLNQQEQIVKLIDHNLHSLKVKESKIGKISENITNLILKYLNEYYFQDLSESWKDKNTLLEDNVIAKNPKNLNRIKHDDSGFFDTNSTNNYEYVGELGLTNLISLGY